MCSLSSVFNVGDAIRFCSRKSYRSNSGPQFLFQTPGKPAACELVLHRRQCETPPASVLQESSVNLPASVAAAVDVVYNQVTVCEP